MLTLTQTSRRFSALHDLHRDKKGDTADVCQSLCSVANFNNFVAIFSALLQLYFIYLFIYFLKATIDIFSVALGVFWWLECETTCRSSDLSTYSNPPTTYSNPLPNLLALPSQSGQMFIPLCPVWKWIVLHNYYIKRNYKNVTVHWFYVTNVVIQMVTLFSSTVVPHLVLWLATRCCRLLRRHKVVEAKNQNPKQLLC